MSNPIPESIAWQSANKGAAWLLALLQPDGSFKGATDLRAYYKTPAALLAHGHTREAHLVLDQIESHLLKNDGDLNGSGVPWFSLYRTYTHSWICTASAMAGRFDMARKLASCVARFAGQNDEIMTTSMAGVALLYAGDIAGATTCGNWLERLYNAQPDLKQGLYTTWRDGLHTTYPEAEAASHRIDPSKPRQYYFQYGISAALLTKLYEKTAEDKWLKLATNFLAASQYAGSDRYQTPQSGKIGWGAAWTFRHTHDAFQRDLTGQVSKGLAALQNDDGSWLVTGVYGGATADADSATIDITSEFVALQSFMAQIPNA